MFNPGAFPHCGFCQAKHQPTRYQSSISTLGRKCSKWILVHDQEVAQRPEETCLCKGFNLLKNAKKAFSTKAPTPYGKKYKPRANTIWLTRYSSHSLSPHRMNRDMQITIWPNMVPYLHGVAPQRKKERSLVDPVLNKPDQLKHCINLAQTLAQPTVGTASPCIIRGTVLCIQPSWQQERN